jgi:hypothetical protein
MITPWRPERGCPDGRARAYGLLYRRSRGTHQLDVVFPVPPVSPVSMRKETHFISDGEALVERVMGQAMIGRPEGPFWTQSVNGISLLNYAMPVHPMCVSKTPFI